MSEKLMTLDELEKAYPADFRNPVYTPEEEASFQEAVAAKQLREKRILASQQVTQRLENPCAECHAINYEDCEHCFCTGIEPDSDDEEDGNNE